jgi:phage terminase large subunit-like protein
MTKIKAIDTYVASILSGEISVCESVKKTVQRHVDDLERSKTDTFAYYFEPKAANHIIQFYQNLRHYKGKWSGTVVELEPWQQFIIGNLFGWLRKSDKKRRFREASIWVPRKNGKTTITAGIGLYGLDYDNEPGAEVYSAATSRDQAKILWRDARQMVKSSGKLSNLFHITDGNSTISNQKTASYMRPLSKDHGRLDGLNVHFALNDEIHAWKDRMLYDVIDTATGAREQPLIVNISTAGVVTDGIAQELLSYGEKMLDGIIENERYFHINYTVDEGDELEWDNPKIWAKANPNYAISVNPDDLHALAKKAQESQQKKNDFLTKRLNIWVKGMGGWMNMPKWNSCHDEAINIEHSYGKPVFLAMDLASKKDLCAIFGLWHDGEKLCMDGKCYIPQNTVDNKEARLKSLFLKWAESGHLTITPGEVTDYDVIETDIKNWAKKSNVISLGYDPFNAAMMVNHLDKSGLKLTEIAMNIKNMSEPMKQLEADALSSAIRHNNPILTWAVSNVQVYRDKKENYYPGKEDESNRIDPAVSVMMCYAMHLLNPIQKFGAKRKLRVWTTA